MSNITRIKKEKLADSPVSTRLPESLEETFMQHLGCMNISDLLTCIVEEHAIRHWGYRPPVGYIKRAGQWILQQAKKNGAAKVLAFTL